MSDVLTRSIIHRYTIKSIEASTLYIVPPLVLMSKSGDIALGFIYPGMIIVL